MYELRKDEYIVDFEYAALIRPTCVDRVADEECRDTTAFAVQRYNDVVETLYESSLSPSDRRTFRDNQDSQMLQAEIQHKLADLTLSTTAKRLINQLQPVLRTLNDFVGFFQRAVQPHKPRIDPLWGLVFLTLKVISSNAIIYGS